MALRKIRQLEKSTELPIRKKPFARLVKEIATEIPAHTMELANEWRFTPGAIEAVQVACEDYMTEI